MAPRRIVLFWFDRDPLVCRSRIALLRRLNPGVPVFGLFGGARGYKHRLFRLAGKPFLGLDALYPSPRPGRANWSNGDLLVAAWYRDVGYRIAFDVAHVVEWDLLFLDSLERIYSSVPADAVGLTALTPLSAVARDWVWMQRADDRRQWDELLAHARQTWGYDQEPYACWFGGTCFPRSFLEAYVDLDPPELATDELRVPLFAQILDVPMVDNGLRPRWHDAETDRFFNNLSTPVEPDVIRAELAKPNGRRVFHSVRVAFDA